MYAIIWVDNGEKYNNPGFRWGNLLDFNYSYITPLYYVFIDIDKNEDGFSDNFREILFVKFTKPTDMTGDWKAFFRLSFMNILKDFADHTKADFRNCDMEFEDPKKEPSPLFKLCCKWWEEKVKDYKDKHMYVSSFGEMHPVNKLILDK